MCHGQVGYFYLIEVSFPKKQGASGTSCGGVLSPSGGQSAFAGIGLQVLVCAICMPTLLDYQPFGYQVEKIQSRGLASVIHLGVLLL